MSFEFDNVSIDLLSARLPENFVPKNVDILNDNVLNGVDDESSRALNGPRVCHSLTHSLMHSPTHSLTRIAIPGDNDDRKVHKERKF